MSNSAVRNMKSIKESIKYQHIAPALELSSSDGKIMPVHKYMSRMHSDSCNGDQIQSVARRNARERNRVKQVNNSFSKLRQHIPQYVINDLTKGGGRGPQKKISKVDTLRIAVEYIRRLQDLVEDLSDNSSLSGISENSSCSTFPMVDATASMGANSPTIVSSEGYSPSKQCYGEKYQTSPLPAFEQTQMEIQRQQQKQYQSILTPSALNQTQLYVGCHSPTSSFNSSMSFDSGHFEAPQQMSPITNSPLQLKHETYNSFNLHEEDCSPDDEEILDYISLWQDQQS